ncbi:MAG: hypothetical protein JWP50_1987, partial [Phenylobacterium sp.]|nr:hypothetical protein [Phenylobacterium sp.]
IKVRGNAQHVFEKYQQLARDANAAGDRVLGENYLQHAEHYFRLLRAIQPQRPPSEILGRDQFSSGFDIDFEDESGAQAQADGPEEGETTEDGAEARSGGGGWQERPRDDRPRDDRPRDDRPRDDRARDDRPRDDRPRDDRPRDDRPRDDRPRGDRGRDRWQERPRDDRARDDRPRDDRPRDDRPRDDRPRDERPRDDRPREDRPRDDRPRDDRSRDDRPRDDRPRDDRPRDDRPRADRSERPREDRPERDPLAVVEFQAQPLPLVSPERASPMLRDAEGGESHAPAFLQQPASRAESGEEETARKPRRRRAPRAAEGDQAGPASSETEEA